MTTLNRLLLITSLLLGLPVATLAQSQPNQINPANATGIQPYVAYGGVRENINLTNGNLNLQVPLLTLPGRNGLDLGVGLEYDSKLWQLHWEYNEFTSWWWWDTETQMTLIGGGAWRLNVPVLNATWRKISPTPTQKTFCYMDFVVVLSDGSKHSFDNKANCHKLTGSNMNPSPSSNVAVADSKDASFARLDTSNESNLVVYLKDGTRIHFSTSLLPGGNEGESFPYSKVADKIVDSDGNMITIQSQPGAPVSSITDTVGRVVSFTWNTGRLSTITYSDSGGTPRTITLAYSGFPINPSFTNPLGNLVVGGGTWQMLDTITLPNGLTYDFDYNNFGELTKIKYPTAGYTSYTYAAYTHWYEMWLSDSTEADFREVTSRRVCRESDSTCASEDVTTYTPTIDGGKTSNEYMDVLDPEGNLTKHKFSLSLSTGANRNYSPRELQRWVYQGQSTLLRTVQTDYEPIGPYGYPENWALPKTITTTVNDITPNLVTKTVYTYDTYMHLPDTVSRIIDNPTEVLEYHFGASTVARKTVNTWLKTLNGQDYYPNPSSGLTTIHIMDRKLSEQVYDGAALKAHTVFEYDSYTEGLTASGVVQHESSFGTGYTTRGNLTAVTRYTNAAAGTGPVTTRNQYDDAGNLLKTTDPLSHNTTFSYSDSWSEGVCAPSGGSAKAYLTSATNHLSHSTTSTYNSCSGTVATTTDPNTQLTTFTYDVMGRLRQTNLPDTGQVLTDYTEPAMPLSMTRTVKITAGMNAVAPTDVDGLGRVTQSRLTSDPQGTIKTDTTYDALGRKKTVSNPYRSASDPTYGVTTFEYDALGRVTKVIPPDGSGTANNVSTTYSGNCTTVTDQAGKKRKSCTDALGRLIEVWEPDASGAFVHQTVYTYDVLDNLLTVVQSGSRQRTFAYNSLSQLTSATNPESGTITYGYDNDGNLQTKTAPKPNQPNPAVTVTITYAYDALHRLTGKSYNDGSTAAVSYFYDGQNPSGTPGTAGSGSVAVSGTLQSSTEGGSPGTGSVSVSGTLKSNTTSATPGTGSVTLSGSLQSSTSDPTPGTGWVDINGLLQSVEFDPCDDGRIPPDPCPLTIYDSGTVWITVNGVQKTVSYGAGSTNSSIATALRNAINGDGSYPVTAGGTGNRVTLTAKTSGSGTNYSLSAGSTYNTTYFSQPSFTTTKSGNNLTGGTDGSTTYDAGNVWITVNGLQKTVSYGQGSTASSVASALRSAINADGSYPVTAGGTGTTVTLTAKTSGSGTNYSLSASSSSTQGFSPPSFSATPSGSTLTGGADPVTTYDSGSVWITVNGLTKSVTYGQGSTASSVASALRSAINADGSYPVTAGGTGTTVTLTAKTSGSATNYSLSAGSSNNDPGTFGSPSFTTSTSGATLTGGTNGTTTYDAGSVWITVNGLQKSVSYSQGGNNTATTVADALRSAINGDPNYPVTAGGTGTTVSLTAKTTGSATNYPLSAGSSSTAGFSPPSFSATPSGSTLTGGSDPSGGCTPVLTITNGTGRRTGMCDAAGGEAWSFDEMGRVLTNVRVTNGVTQTFSYSYNQGGGILTYTNGQGVTFSQSFSGAAQVTQLTSSWVDPQHPGTLASNIQYHPHGAVKKMTLGNGLTETAAYNNRLQPCRKNVNSSGTLITQCTDPVPTGNVLDFAYGFNHGTADNGNVMTWAAVGQQNFSRSYTYDELNRIKTLSGTGGSCTGLSWSYDVWGNRTNQTVTSGSCTMSSLGFNTKNQITNSGFTYDAAGNQTAEPGKSYSYDAENRMISVNGGSTATYVYDGDGRRVKKVAGGATTLYFRDVAGLVVSELDGAGSFQVGYVYLNGQLLALYKDSTTYFAHKDHLGSTRLLTKLDQSIQECIDYLPFGEQRTDTCVTPGASTTSHKFTGHERDAESTLDYMVARHYAFTLGRFLQPDPLLNSGRPNNPQSWNRYSYAFNNPLKYVDPLGLYNLVNTCAQDDKKCNKKFQKNADKLKNGVENLKKKLEKVKDPVQKARLEKALATFGTENDGNNVNVSFGPTPSGTGSGETVPVYNQQTGEHTFNVTLDPNQLSAKEDYAVAAAHEGTHITDIKTALASPLMPQLSNFSFEYRAYQTSAWAASALGFASLSLDYDNKSYEIWNSTWGIVDAKLTQYISSFRDGLGRQSHPETKPHNPWPD